MSTHRRIDKLIKDNVEKHSIEYDPSHWQAMEMLLDKERNHHRFGILYWMILGFIILSLGLFIGLDQYNKQDIAPGNDQMVEANGLSTESKASIELIPLDEVNSHSVQTSPGNGTDLSREMSHQFLPDRKLEGSGQVSDLPLQHSIADLTFQSGIDIQENDDNVDRTSLLKNAGINPVNTPQSEVLQGILYEKPWKKLWTMGIGWQVENSWGWSTGAFASLGLKLHESISISFRPGFTLRSNNTMPSESYKQVEYDFGRTDIEGEINKLESYAVDVPLSVQLHKQRHILSLGGGIHYAFMQRVSITERQLSNFSNFTNSRTPFFENVDQRKAWVQPDESLYPFAELYYSYLLTPSFELGGRSRFYMPEDMHLSNRLNFAAQLVWYIN